MFWVLGYINRFTVVLDSKLVCHTFNLNRLHWIFRLLLSQTNRVIVCVDQQFINEFVESRIEGNSGCFESIFITKKDFFTCSFNTANVCVWKREDVFTVRLALISGRKVCHFGTFNTLSNSRSFFTSWVFTESTLRK